MSSATTLSFDIKAEAYAAAILHLGDPISGLHQILIKPTGVNGRQDGRDISGVSRMMHYENEQPTEFLYLDVTREGLLDLIPQGIFTDPGSDTEDSLAKVEMYEARRKEMYRFLLPFEQAIFQPRIAVEQSEAGWLLDENAALDRMFGEFIRIAFGAYTDLTDPELVPIVKKLVAYLPWSQLILDDEEIRTNAIRTIMDMDITLETVQGKSIQVPGSFLSSLGPGLHLGENFLIGETFSDGLAMNNIKVNINDMDDLETWMTDGVKYNFVQNILVHLFFPADTQVDIKLNITEDMRSFYLSTESGTSSLGYVTYL